ncbi:helix-turn-helix domain-containing protein [Phytomonospora endophytica]|uniref:Helix-turn-helix domain-containing protein n=1 Tax=Phytomonospora endophytica TaxID=714109 RepID=A0A841FLL9_9ACTN|nr:helix-turn-helix domain-containing protein [Phytomonospora endophytica]MBB6038221.1 hypothetical protein [Phytomonospora endophytica]GIG67320.1 hypothetical protein Pen01_36150 [Phytomonospora endophytica]
MTDEQAGSSPDPGAEWWTTTEVAAYLHVHISTVSGYRRREQMPAPDQTIGRTHVWQPNRIIEWHEKRPRPGTGGRPTHKPKDASDGETAEATS